MLKHRCGAGGCSAGNERSLLPVCSLGAGIRLRLLFLISRGAVTGPGRNTAGGAARGGGRGGGGGGGGGGRAGTPQLRSDTPMSGAGGNGTPPESLQDYELAGKVMLLGDSGVGKTCFLLQFKDGAFLSGTFIATVGIDFRNKVVAVDGVKVKLQIWDMAGQERFRSVTHAYYRDAQALLLLYDITSKVSFDNIRVSVPTACHGSRGCLSLCLGTSGLCGAKAPPQCSSCCPHRHG
ncbi:ras-related protein Rab-37 isoform X1 [Coturnix japonica]|uniref:ras-related protein Rab-37 isoform X1 n=1 Tax=Coturnix japonica TaxID=93934 RepID=UPI0013A5CE8D|nr:ras-related protein Rab-37 isoform X1 [Coturnix japonica]